MDLVTEDTESGKEVTERWLPPLCSRSDLSDLRDKQPSSEFYFRKSQRLGCGLDQVFFMLVIHGAAFGILLRLKVFHDNGLFLGLG